MRGAVDLVRTTAALFSFEAQQTAQVAGARLIVILLSISLLISGVALVVSGVAFFVGKLMGEVWLGFAIVGVATLACGAGVMAWAVHSIASREDLRFPETRDQIRRDMKWLDQQLGRDGEKSSSD